MGILKQTVAFIVAGIIGGAVVAYVDAYHVLEIHEGFKFKTPAAVWEFQFNIWGPVVLIMALIFGGASLAVRLYLKTNRESSRLMFASLSALTLVAVLYLTPKVLDGPLTFLAVLLVGPVAAATMMECRVAKAADEDDM